MDPSVASPARSPGKRRGALLGLAVALGWVLHDALFFARLTHPHELLGLAAGSLLALAAGALVGALLAGRPRSTALLLALLAALSFVPVALHVPLSRARIWLPRATFLLLAAWVLATVARRRLPHSDVLLGTALGLLVCAAKTELRAHTASAGIPEPLALWLLPVALLAAGFARPSWIRRGAVTAALLLAALQVGARVRRTLSLPRPDLEPPTAAVSGAHPNVLFVVLDTVRADHLAPYGYARVTTPELDAWAAEHATRWTEARSTAPWTLPSHASLFTGLYPSQHGATTLRGGAEDARHLTPWPTQPLREDVRTLAEDLRAAGYRTGAVVANCFYLRSQLGLDQGFEHYDDRRAGSVGDYLALAQLGGYDLRCGHRGYRDAGQITDLALRWIDGVRGERPFLLFLNYLDAHEPYLPPPSHRRDFGAVEPRDPLAPLRAIYPLLYDRELRGLDEQLGRLLRGIERRGLLDSTAIVITADHGEGFGEHSIWYHCWGLYDELIHVPLYVKPAGGRDAPVCDEPIDGTGVHDLVLRLAGLEPAPRDPSPVTSEWYYGGEETPAVRLSESAFGRDLERDLVAWEQGSCKLIVSSTGEVEAYDLAADPDEEDPLDLSPAVARAARERAADWWAAHPPPAPVRGVAVDDELLQEMRAVGYAGE